MTIPAAANNSDEWVMLTAELCRRKRTISAIEVVAAVTNVNDFHNERVKRRA